MCIRDRIKSLRINVIVPGCNVREIGRTFIKNLSEKGKGLKHVGFINACYLSLFTPCFAAFSYSKGKITKSLGNRTCQPERLTSLICICLWASIMNSSGIK